MRFQFKTSGSKRLTRSFEHGDVLAPVGWFTIFQDRAMNANTSDKSKNQNGVAGVNPYMEGKPSNTLKKGTKTLITSAQIVATSPIQRMNSKSLRNEAIVTSEDETTAAKPQRIDLTQFEDIPKQMEIKWHEHPIYGARYLIQISEPETPWVVGAVVPDFELHDDYAKDKIEQEKMAKLFAATPNLIAELKRCYEMIDKMQGNVPYVEHCEECGATDGGEAEGCDYCGITHYRSKPRGFLHRDSPKW